jgi:Mce-associated membrane protein
VTTEVDAAELDEELEETEPEEPDEPDEPTQDSRWRGRRLPIALLAAAVVLVAAGVWLLVDANGTRTSASARNRALQDPAATAEVSASVTNSLNRIFTYSFDKTQATEQAATEVLRGKALDTYRELFAQVRDLAPQQKIVLTTRVVSAAVQELNDEHAQLLVFLDQSATRADNNSTSAAAAQLSVTAKREGVAWVIVDLVPR